MANTSKSNLARSIVSELNASTHYNSASLNQLVNELDALNSNVAQFPTSIDSKSLAYDPATKYVSSSEFAGGLKSSKKTATSIYDSGIKYFNTASKYIEQAHTALKNAMDNFSDAAQGIFHIDNDDKTSGKEINGGDSEGTTSILASVGGYSYSLKETHAATTNGGIASGLAGTLLVTNLTTGETEEIAFDTSKENNGIVGEEDIEPTSEVEYNDENNDGAISAIEKVHEEDESWEEEKKELEEKLERGEITLDDYKEKESAHYERHSSLVDAIPGDVDPEKVAPITDDMTASEKLQALDDQYNVKLSKYHEGLRNNDYSLAEQTTKDAQTLETEQYKLLPDLAKEYDGKISDVQNNLASGAITKDEANAQMADLTQEFNDKKQSIEYSYNAGTNHNETSGANLTNPVNATRTPVQNSDGTTTVTTTYTDAKGNNLGTTTETYTLNAGTSDAGIDTVSPEDVGTSVTKETVTGTDGNTYYKTSEISYDENDNPIKSVTYQDASGNQVDVSKVTRISNNGTENNTQTSIVNQTSTGTTDESFGFVTGNDGSEYVNASDEHLDFDNTTTNNTSITNTGVINNTSTSGNNAGTGSSSSASPNVNTNISGKTVVSTQTTTNTTYTNGQTSTSIETVNADGAKTGTSSISGNTVMTDNVKPAGIQKETVVTYSDGSKEVLRENNIIGTPPTTAKTPVSTTTKTTTTYANGQTSTNVDTVNADGTRTGSINISGSGSVAEGSTITPAGYTKETQTTYSDGTVSGTMNRTIIGTSPTAPKTQNTNANVKVQAAQRLGAQIGKSLKDIYGKASQNVKTDLGNNNIKSGAIAGAAAIPVAGMTLNSIYRKHKDKKEQKIEDKNNTSSLSFKPEDMDKLPDGNDYFKI